MDGGVRRLVVDVISESDGMNVGYAFVRREHAFEGFFEEDIDDSSLYPRGPLMVCTIDSLREFIEQFPFLRKPELALIAEKHGIRFKSRLTVTMRKDALRRHTCVPECAQLLYIFRALDRPRKVAFVAPSLDDPRHSTDEIEELRQKTNKRRRMQRKRHRERESVVEQFVEYPPVRSFEQKSEIIHEWQAMMDPENLRRGVCAVCAQLFEASLLHRVLPNEEMLILLESRMPHR